MLCAFHQFRALLYKRRLIFNFILTYFLFVGVLPNAKAQEANVVDVYESQHQEYREAKDEILSRGAKLAIDEFYQIAAKYKIDTVGRIKLWKLFSSLQKVSITKEEFFSLVHAKRNAVKDITCSYHVGNNSYKYVYKSERQFYFEKNETSESHFHEIRSLNRNDYRKVLFPESGMDADSNKPLADILPLEDSHLEDGECLEMPLFQTMLFDTKFFGVEYWWADICLYMQKFPLSCFFEQYQIVNNHRCLVLADPYSQVYLDIDKDLSLYMFVDYRVIENKDKDESALPFTRYINTSRTMHDLKDYGNGIWLPSRIETKSYRPDGTVGVETNIIYDEIIINGGIPDRFFEDVIPDNAIVLDAVRNISYIWGDHASIGSLIKETVKSKRQTIFRNLSLILGLCFIACWGIVEWRKRRLQKGEVE